MKEYRWGTQEITEFVVEDSVRAVIAQAIFVLVVLAALVWWRQLAIVLFWADTIFVSLFVIFRALALLLGIILLITRLFVKDDPRAGEVSLMAQIFRTIEACAVTYSCYFLFIRIYPGSKFLWLFS